MLGAVGGVEVTADCVGALDVGDSLLSTGGFDFSP